LFDADADFYAVCFSNHEDHVLEYTGCGKLTSFFEYEMPYEKGS
jgi:hypothetical protein